MRVLSVLLLSLLALPAAGDEGMWLLNQFPKDAVNQKHKVEITDEFLKHLRLSSVRIGGGSGSFVSPNGLLLTNQHLVTGCLNQTSLKDGFYADTQSGELRCPGLDAAVLLNIDDVTSQVKSAAKDGTTAAQKISERNATIALIEKDCSAKTGDVCSVVKLFSGGRYDLYRYKRYNDVRLVFVPEQALAFFGRERDSITYLRYGLDIAFLRAYENGKPAATAEYLKWSSEGVKEGSAVFAAGNPGATARATTAAQLAFYRDRSLLFTLQKLAPRIQQVSAYASQSEENQRAAEQTLTGLLENYKSVAGKLIGLRDDRLVGRKTLFDQKIRHAVEADPKLGTEAGKVWDEVAAAYKSWSAYEKPYQLLDGSPALGSNLFRVARRLASGQALAQDADTPINEVLEIVLMTQYIEELRNLGEKEAPLKGIVTGKTAQQAAEALVKSSKLKDPAERRRLAADPGALAKSDDGFIRLALRLNGPAQKLRTKREELIGALEASAAEQIAQYRFQLFGAADYPDGTHTPRVQFGVVKGYTDRAGVKAPYAATFSGLYYRRQNEGPYAVSQRWVDAKNVSTSLRHSIS